MKEDKVNEESKKTPLKEDLAKKKPAIKKKSQKATKRADKKATKKAEKIVKKLEKKAGIKPIKKVSKVRVIITSIILALVLVLIGGVIYIFTWGNDIISKITGGTGNVFDALIFFDNTVYEPLKTASDGRTNILAFGTSGFDMSGTDYNGKSHDGAALTDSIMVISINQEAGDIAMISLPRDLKAAKTCTATGKINETYWCNSYKYKDKSGVVSTEGETLGAQALMNEVGSILGLEIQYFVHVNWGSLVSIVNTLGGINITLDENVNDTGTGTYYAAGTTYLIDGEHALGLARARKGTVGGDFSRGNSQQKILIGIKDRIYEKNVSLVDMISLVSTLGDNVRTNLSMSEIKTAAHLTFEFNFDLMRQVALVDYSKNIYYFTTATINNISYVVPRAGVGNYSKIQAYVAEQIKTPVIEEETSGEETE